MLILGLTVMVGLGDCACFGFSVTLLRVFGWDWVVSGVVRLGLLDLGLTGFLGSD